MARRTHRRLKRIIWLSVLCTSLQLLVSILKNMDCKKVSVTPSPVTTTAKKDKNTNDDILVTLPSVRKKSFLRSPETFWNLREGGFWNRLQRVVDDQFNPLLSLQNSTVDPEDRVLNEVVMGQSFLKVSQFDSITNTAQLPEMLHDFVNYMQRRDYPTLMQPHGTCGAGASDETEYPFLLLAIKSTEPNFESRQAIRRTWGQTGWVSGLSSEEQQPGGYVRRVFLLGKISDSNSSELLQTESKLYGDILQWDFKDSFFNLTLKDVLLWKWFSRFCSRTRFVFKGGDNIYMNMQKMMTYLHNQLRKPRSEEWMKTFMVGSRGIALTKRPTEYSLPDIFYKGAFPAHASGAGLVYSGLLTEQLYTVSQRVHLFPIDEIYVGMCLSRLSVFPFYNPTFLTSDVPNDENRGVCFYHRNLVVHEQSPSDLIQIWDGLEKTQTQCWELITR